MMQEVLPKIWTWSWFSEEKGYFFNSIAVIDRNQRVLIDPVWLNPEKEAFLEKLGPFDAIYLTNKDHERTSYDLRRKWSVPIGIHQEDANLMKSAPDFTFVDGQDLACGLRVMHLENQKSPGECAFYMKSHKVLIVGDALIGDPPGSMRLLPAIKYKDVRKARESLKKIQSVEIESLLVGDGTHIFENASKSLEQVMAPLPLKSNFVKRD